MPAPLRPLTPAPTPRPRGGTFEGLEKLFFDKAAAIEAGELTAPPEVFGAPLHPWLAAWRARPIYQKLGGAAALVFLLAAALVMFGPRPAPAVAPAQSAKPLPSLPKASQAAAPASRHVPPTAPVAAPETGGNRAPPAVGPATLQARPSRHGHARERAKAKAAKAKAAKTKRHRAPHRRPRPLDPFD